MADSPHITEVFRIGPEKYLRVDAGRRLKSYIIVAVLIAAALAIAGISDIRYLFLCFIFMMMAYVTALTMLWASMGTQKQVLALRHTPQQWTFHRDGIKISFPESEMAPVTIGFDKVLRVTDNGKHLRLTIAPGIAGCESSQTLFIPTSLVPAATITQLIDL